MRSTLGEIDRKLKQIRVATRQRKKVFCEDCTRVNMIGDLETSIANIKRLASNMHNTLHQQAKRAFVTKSHVNELSQLMQVCLNTEFIIIIIRTPL